jgi:hypothetical protein
VKHRHHRRRRSAIQFAAFHGTGPPRRPPFSWSPKSECSTGCSGLVNGPGRWVAPKVSANKNKRFWGYVGLQSLGPSRRLHRPLQSPRLPSDTSHPNRRRRHDSASAQRFVLSSAPSQDASPSSLMIGWSQSCRGSTTTRRRTATSPSGVPSPGPSPAALHLPLPHKTRYHASARGRGGRSCSAPGRCTAVGSSFPTRGPILHSGSSTSTRRRLNRR